LHGKTDHDLYLNSWQAVHFSYIYALLERQNFDTHLFVTLFLCALGQK